MPFDSPEEKLKRPQDQYQFCQRQLGINMPKHISNWQDLSWRVLCSSPEESKLFESEKISFQFFMLTRRRIFHLVGKCENCQIGKWLHSPNSLSIKKISISLSIKKFSLSLSIKKLPQSFNKKKNILNQSFNDTEYFLSDFQ